MGEVEVSFYHAALPTPHWTVTLRGGDRVPVPSRRRTPRRDGGDGGEWIETDTPQEILELEMFDVRVRAQGGGMVTVKLHGPLVRPASEGDPPENVIPAAVPVAGPPACVLVHERCSVEAKVVASLGDRCAQHGVLMLALLRLSGSTCGRCKTPIAPGDRVGFVPVAGSGVLETTFGEVDAPTAPG
jgi:hypothetical protein